MEDPKVRRPAARRKWRPSIQQYAVLLLLALIMSAGPLVLKPPQATNDRIVKLTILQLNDVYQILPNNDGTGGLARVATLEKQVLSESNNVMFVLAGDTISPSLESSKFQGRQMIDLWNNLGLNVAVLGNHEFDFKPDVLRERIKESHFTWLAANVIDKHTGSPFGGAQRFLIREVDGVRVGIFGLLTVDTVQSSQPGPDIEFLDAIETTNQIVPQMRAQGAQVIIALTHLPFSEDQRLAQSGKVNLILGGHDHNLIQSQAGNVPIYKMGSDARNLGRIDISIQFRTGGIERIDYQRMPVTKSVAEEGHTKGIIDDYEKQLAAQLGGIKLDDPIGQSEVDLDAQQESVRARESNVGDFVADTFREVTKADVALVNGGGLRSDLLYPAGPITNRHVYSILPFRNKVVVIEVKGAELRQALERGVSRVVEDGQDGGFPQVSGLQFVYNGLANKGARVVSVTVTGQPLDDNKTYKLATISYLADGNEGYDMFRGKADLIPAGSNKFDVDIILEKIKSTGKISPKTDGRITRRDG